MSEYQYYEFHAIDRPLAYEEQQAVAKLSSRVDPHPRRAVFTYSWSDLPADPRRILARYYDAMLYMANWGSIRLMFRFPLSTVDVERMQAYCPPGDGQEFLSFSSEGEYAIFDLNLYENEGGGWIEGEGGLDALIPLREDILRGDYRALYLAWLKTLELEDALDSDLEPPVPAGLKTLTPALRRFVELFEIDEGLIEAASQASETPSAASDTLAQATTWAAIAALPRDECDAFLLRLAQGERHLGLALKARLRELVPELETQAAQAPRRTVGWLLGEAARQDELARRRRIEEAERRRIKELEALAKREPHTWTNIETLIQRRTGPSYGEAVELLVKLRDLAEYQGRTADFQQRVSQIRARYQSYTALQRRIKEAGL
jgi:hypothetical protein